MFQLELDGSLRTTEPNARAVGERKGVPLVKGGSKFEEC
jgi:hypothetical protein